MAKIPIDDSEAAVAMDDGIWDFPSDILVEILLRLPTSSRRRFRLVCSHWRDLVDNRTAEMQSRPKTLIINNDAAFVVDASKRGSEELWRRGEGHPPYGHMEVVGTCNGLLCLCDNTKPGGAITLANPHTGDTLAIPPLPCDGLYTTNVYKWHEAYSFAYHPRTGKYKIVHVPCSFDRLWEFDRLQVFTLGTTSWRDVTVPSNMRCRLDIGLISIDGIVYWITEFTEKIMAFDLHVMSIESSPPMPAKLAGVHLTEVHGRLGVAINCGTRTLKNIEVWVLQSANGKQRCIPWYNLRLHLPPMYQTRWMQNLPLPHFVHGDFLLTSGWTVDTNYKNLTYFLYTHRPCRSKRFRGGTVETYEGNQGTAVANIAMCAPDWNKHGMFTYVSTTACTNIGEGIFTVLEMP